MLSRGPEAGGLPLGAERVRWPRSVVTQGVIAAFLAAHIPLLVLLAVVTLRPQWLTPWGVLVAALGATLVAAASVVAVLWWLFRPVRLAADGLLGFMTQGRQIRLSIGSQDEIGRLVQQLVAALAHLEHGHAPAAPGVVGPHPTRAPQLGTRLPVVALLEVDQWRTLDEAADVQRMHEVQVAVHRRIRTALNREELVQPWGRGRFLVVMNGPLMSARERLKAMCQRFVPTAGRVSYSCSAVVDARSDSTSAWPATVQRLDQRLFALRLSGGSAVVN